MADWLRDVLLGLAVSAGGIVGAYGLRVWWSAILWLAEALA